MARKITPKVVVHGKLIQANPSTTFLVELDDGKQITAYFSGPTVKYYIRVQLGDRVRIQLSATDPAMGKITRVWLQPAERDRMRAAQAEIRQKLKAPITG